MKPLAYIILLPIIINKLVRMIIDMSPGSSQFPCLSFQTTYTSVHHTQTLLNRFPMLNPDAHL